MIFVVFNIVIDIMLICQLEMQSMIYFDFYIYFEFGYYEVVENSWDLYIMEGDVQI